VQQGEKTQAKMLFTPEQIHQRVRQIAQEVSDDFRDKTLYVVCVLENGFIFAADLVRALDVAVVCQFLKPDFREIKRGAVATIEIFFSPEVKVKGQDVLLVEALVQSGLTSDFLMRNLMGRGARSVKLAALLDKQSARRIALKPDYFGFVLDEDFVVGYGLGSPDLGRNLPYIARAQAPGVAASK